MITLYTMGFTKKSAEEFFGKLKVNGVKRLIDTRLSNSSQLSGFAKKDDLRYFLDEICGVEYHHDLNLAPTATMLDHYRKTTRSWNEYEEAFLQLMEDRRIEEKFSPEFFDNSCLLCSEHRPHQCHRRLVAEYLKQKWQKVEIRHIL